MGSFERSPGPPTSLLVGVESWLFIEDIFLYRAYGKPACFDFFRHAQHLVLTGWLATLVVLTLLYFGKEILSRD